MSKSIFFVCGLFFCGNFALAEALNLPKDSEGWTIFTPSDDSRIMYISADGDDSTGIIYDDNDTVLGGNPFNPAGPINSFATYAAAFAHVRQGYPDWVLFRRGDVFVDVIGRDVGNGRSESEPALVAAYGNSANSPILKTGASSGINPIGARRWLAFSGLSFYAHTRNMNDPDYAGNEGGNGFSFYATGENLQQNIHVEGCRFSYYKNNTVQGVSVKNITLRRCVITNNYNEAAHAQGIYASSIDGLVVSESIFDHNGWVIQSDGTGSKTGGMATIFNHNTYFSDTDNTYMHDNIFMRPSSMHNKFTASNENQTNSPIVSNNLYIDGEIAISMGGNDTDFYRFENVSINNNVITNLNESHPTNRTLAFGISIQDWDGGSLNDNYIINSDEGNSWGFLHKGTSRNISVTNNKIYNFKNLSNAFVVDGSRGSNVINAIFSNNHIQIPELSGYTIKQEYDSAGKWTFFGNKYFSNRNDGTQFNLNGTDVSLAQWQSATNDNSVFEEVAYADTSRTIEAYTALQGESATVDAFILRARAQDKYSWDSRFTAEAVNSWIKAGFATADFRADVDGSSEITTTDALLTLRNSLGLSMTGTAWRVSATTGDVNCDGVSNSTDALLILRYSLGLSMDGTTWCE